MSSFSSLLDISSFFIGVLVNLLLVAMICFYFKRKIDNLELSQSEQAKILFQLLQQQQPTGVPGSSGDALPILNNLDLNQLGGSDEEDENTNSAIQDEDSDIDSDSDDESVQEEEVETKTIEYEQSESPDVDEEEEDVKDDSNYSKMTVKELRSLLENKGVPLSSRKLKKKELIQLASTTNLFSTDEPQPQPEPQPEPVEEEVMNEVQPEIVDDAQSSEVKPIQFIDIN
jgi:hypothetical protein